MLNQISGGVCAAKGFTAAGVHCGVKAGSSPDKNDLALILSEKECAAAHAIMTTDTVKKEIAVSLTIGGKEVRLGAIAKGSGMIHPNMGTMLAFITTDCAITHEMLSDALHEVVARTFNRVTVDGDTSTNDMVVVLANGAAGNTLVT